MVMRIRWRVLAVVPVGLVMGKVLAAALDKVLVRSEGIQNRQRR